MNTRENKKYTFKSGSLFYKEGKAKLELVEFHREGLSLKSPFTTQEAMQICRLTGKFLEKR